jgi:Spy/CpxP family protein refolding chaperone
MGMAMHLLHLGEELGLSDQQKTDIEAVLEAARPQMEELRNSMKEGREQWREGFDPANFDEQEARNFAESQAAIHVELMVLGMKTRSQVFAILTPEQQEQMRSFREEGGHAGCGHHMGGSHHEGCKGRS